MNQSADASSMQNNNPLLDIDISFSSYINARTRSFKSHVINGALDYAFDADFSMRQKIHGISGWNKLYKTIVSNDIPAKVKKLFHTSSIAGSLKFPVIYEATCKCAFTLRRFRRNKALLTLQSNIWSSHIVNAVIVLNASALTAYQKLKLLRSTQLL